MTEEIEEQVEEEEEETCAECSICGIEHVIAEMSTDYSSQWEYLCSRCCSYIITCWNCEDELIDTRNDNYWNTHSGNVICEGCRESYSECDGCGNLFRTDDMYWDDDDDGNGGGFCRPCHDEREPQLVRSYSYKPSPEFRISRSERANDKTWYAGIEVEINVPDRDQLDPYVKKLQAADDRDLFYCKSDGSIGHGFEIVSHPMSWRWMQENPDWVAPITLLSKLGCVSYTGHNCGMHVHTPKASYGPMMMKRIHSFIRLNPEFIRLFANRTRQRLYEWANPDCSVQIETKMCKMKSGGDKYKAFSLNARTTAEFRIFRGTMSEDGIKRNIEFCHALWSHSQNTDRITINSLLEFTKQYRKLYPRMFEKMQKVIVRDAVIEEMNRKHADTDFLTHCGIDSIPKWRPPIRFDNLDRHEWTPEFVRRYIPDANFDGTIFPVCMCGPCMTGRTDPRERSWAYYDNDTGRYYATDAFFEDHPVRARDPDVLTLEQINRAARMAYQAGPIVWSVNDDAGSWSIVGDGMSIAINANTQEEPPR